MPSNIPPHILRLEEQPLDTMQVSHIIGPEFGFPVPPISVDLDAPASQVVSWLLAGGGSSATLNSIGNAALEAAGLSTTTFGSLTFADLPNDTKWAYY